MKRILYISHSLIGSGKSALDDIALVATQRNSGCGVTGYLYYDDNTFIQVIEGPCDDVDAIYGSIKRDPRHEKVKTLMDAPITSRAFGGWAMGLYSGEVGLLSAHFADDIAETATPDDAPELIRFLRNVSIGRNDIYVLPSDEFRQMI